MAETEGEREFRIALHNLSQGHRLLQSVDHGFLRDPHSSRRLFTLLFELESIIRAEDGCTIRCGFCQRSYTRLAATQGVDCACHAHGRLIRGSYGSDFDLRCFRWTFERDFLTEKLVCDHCIKDMLDKGEIVEVE